MKNQSIVFLPFLVLFLLLSHSFSQVTGVVADSQGNPLENVLVESLDHDVSTLSAADGSFELLLDDPTSVRLVKSATFEFSALRRNPGSFQPEIHQQAKNGLVHVFDLQGSYLRSYSAAQSQEQLLPKALSSQDTIIFTLAGYVADSVMILDDEINVDTIVLLSTTQFLDSRDGEVYEKVVIGGQTWMAENLNYSGDDGMGNKTYEIGWCYDFDMMDTTDHSEGLKCKFFGRHYTWHMVMDGSISSNSNPSGVQGICPDGWHVPSSSEWEALTAFVIDNTNATSLGDVSPYLKSTNGWYDNGNGNDEFGFSALPCGFRLHSGGFGAKEFAGSWWSANDSSEVLAFEWTMHYSNDYVSKRDLYKYTGFSLRCVQN